MNKTFEKLLTEAGGDQFMITIKDSETDESCTLYPQAIIEEGKLKFRLFDNETGEFYGALVVDESILNQAGMI